jgi:putative spermidine/putrescine transport system permease protein
MKPGPLGRFLYGAANAAMVTFLLFPIAVVMVFSLSPENYMAIPPTGVSFRWFQRFLTSRDFIQAFQLSFVIAAITIVISVSLGTLAALALTRGKLPGSAFLTALFLSPIMLPLILTGLALFQLYMMLEVGRTFWGLIAAHVVITMPYVIRTTLAVLHNFDTSLEEAARGLGASPARSFFEVTLPIIRPGVIAGAIFAFIVSFDQFPVSLFLVEPGLETLPIVMFNYLRFDFDPTIAAASSVSIVLALIVVIVLERTVGLQEYTKL